MSDIIDDANDHAMKELDLRIRAARGKTTTHSDICLNCGDPSKIGSSFCCAECRDDHEARARQIKLRGGI